MRRLGIARLLGPHGSAVPAPLPGVWRDVDGSVPAVLDPDERRAAADALRARLLAVVAGTRPRSRSGFRPLVGVADTSHRTVARARRSLEVRVLLGGVAGAAYVVGVVLWRSGGPPYVVQAGFVGAVTLGLWSLGSWALRRARAARTRRAAREAHRGHVSWAVLAAAHGWRATRRGVVPFLGWGDLPELVSIRDASRPVALTLSGLVGDWHTWVLVGRGGRPASGLVVGLWVPGADLPYLRVTRGVGRDPDAVRLEGHAVLAELVWTPEVQEHLGATLPPSVELVVRGDLLCLVLAPGTETAPWRADTMVACLVGLADLLPPLVLLVGIGAMSFDEAFGGQPGTDPLEPHLEGLSEPVEEAVEEPVGAVGTQPRGAAWDTFPPRG